MVTLVNRAKMSVSGTPSTGPITLNAAVDGFQTFADAGVTDGQTVRYVIEDGTAWEIGTGTYTASGPSLSRTVIESSNADAEIAATSDALVFLTAAAGDILQPSDLAAGTGIDITGTTITNTAPDQTVSLTEGSNVTITGTYPNFTIASTDTNTTYTAGSGLSLTGTEFANTAPDQTVVLTEGSNVTITGTYPNFTIASTDTNTTYTAGSGLSLTGTEFANTAPDQTVVFTNGTGISVTGTYPNFTVTNTAPDQTVSLTEGSNVTITGTYPSFTIAATDTNTTYTNGTGLNLVGTTFSVDVGTTASKIVQLDGSARLPAVDGSQLTNLPAPSGVMSSTDPVVSSGTITEDVFEASVSGNVFLDANNGSIQALTLTGGTSIFDSNFLGGKAVTLMLNDAGSHSVNWPFGMIWLNNGGSAPTLPDAGTWTVVILWRHNSGSNLLGLVAGNV